MWLITALLIYVLLLYTALHGCMRRTMDAVIVLILLLPAALHDLSRACWFCCFLLLHFGVLLSHVCFSSFDTTLVLEHHAKGLQLEISHKMKWNVAQWVTGLGWHDTYNDYSELTKLSRKRGSGPADLTQIDAALHRSGIATAMDSKPCWQLTSSAWL